MKTSTIICLFLAAFLFGCFGTDYQVKTTVNSDGSIDREISFMSGDSLQLQENLFAASARRGWSLETRALDSTKKLAIRFSRKFDSDSAANTSMFYGADTRLRIRADLEKTEWWFYEEIRYKDTFKSPVMFNYVKADSFFTQDDYDFMRRFSGPEKKSPEDSARQVAVEARVEKYFARGIFEEGFVHILDLCRQDGVEPRWIDTLRRHKMDMFNYGLTSDNEMQSQRSFLLDSLKIPLVKDPPERFEVNTDRLFVSIFDTFHHTIEMPGDITESNADSVNGRFAYWRLGADFTLHDYEMYAETSKIDWGHDLIAVAMFALVAIIIRRWLLKGLKHG